MNKNEIKDALEALDRMLNDHQDPDAEGISYDDYYIVKNALTRLSAIEPLLLELIEARGKATEGEWYSHELFVSFAKEVDAESSYRIAVVPTAFQRAIGYPVSRANTHFITLSANNIAKIKEIMEGNDE